MTSGCLASEDVREHRMLIGGGGGQDWAESVFKSNSGIFLFNGKLFELLLKRTHYKHVLLLFVL